MVQLYAAIGSLDPGRLKSNGNRKNKNDKHKALAFIILPPPSYTRFVFFDPSNCASRQ